MPHVTLLLAIHNHQPDGNFDEVFAAGHDDCYARILAALDEAPHVRASLHHTGPLLEWLAEKRPGYLAHLRRLVARGQVEILGGAFYEPMLAVLPERDARGQIEMMRGFTERHLGVRPEGMWLAERVYEPHLAQLLADCGVRFTLLDDGHFRQAGARGPFHGYYSTEKAGRPLALFPIDQALRYAIPFRTPEQTIAAIYEAAHEVERARAAAGDPPAEVVLTYGDDGEKLGLWPGTREWVWDKGWVRGFFRLLGEHAQSIRTGHFGDVLRRCPPSGRVYLPTASYEEMGTWSLPAEAQRDQLSLARALADRGLADEARPFLRGGLWQGFLARYPEANAMHKKMVAVSDKVARATAARPEHVEENALMTRELYRAQCNCSYWHGLFGGLYLNYLRDAVWRHLLVAEAFADAALGRPAPSWAAGKREGEAAPILVEEGDLDADLEDEIAIATPRLAIQIRPHEGGAVAELSDRTKSFALTNVLSRWPEAYHAWLRDPSTAPRPADVRVKEPGLEQHLVYDRRPQRSFVDRFLLRATTAQALSRSEHEEKSDFPFARWSVAARPPETRAAGSAEVLLERHGFVDYLPVRAEKRFLVEKAALTVRLRLLLSDPSDRSPGARSLHGLDYVPTLALTLLDGRSPERRYEVNGKPLPPDEALLASRGQLEHVEKLSLVNEANGFRVDLSFERDGEPARVAVVRFPLETVSMSEGGFERIYQGSVLAPRFHVDGDRLDAAVRLSVSDL